MSQLKIIAVAIPALGALILGLADRLGYSPRVEAPDDATTATTGYRRIAWLAASLTLATVLCAALVDRSVGTRGVPGADGIGFSYSLLTSAAWLAVILTARQCDRRHTRLLYGLLLLLESAFLGLFLADSVLVLCLFWGSSSWILSLLIAGWGGSERDRAARRFLCFNLAADMLVTVALLGAVVAGARMSAAMTGSNR